MSSSSSGFTRKLLPFPAQKPPTVVRMNGLAAMVKINVQKSLTHRIDRNIQCGIARRILILCPKIRGPRVTDASGIDIRSMIMLA